MKKFILGLTLISSSIISWAQTYLSPVFSFDLTRLENKYEGTPEEYLIISENGYVIDGISVGIKARQNISKSVFVTILSNYSSKTIKADKYIFIDVDGIKYNYFHNHFSINYSLPYMYVGTGVSWSFLSNIKYAYQNRGAKYQSSDKGVIITLGRTFSKIDLELYYYKGLTTINIGSLDLYLKPTNSIGLTIAYSIKVANGIIKNPDCPKF